MKKIVFTAAFTFMAFFMANAQQEVSKNALGLRFGSNYGIGAEITYQRALKDNNRLELDLGWRSNNDYNSVKITGIYQWMWNIQEGFNWYAGVGGGVSSWNYDNRYVSDNGASLLVAGQIGIEYNFDIPLQVSLDFRPEFYLNDNDHRKSFGPDVAIGVRYKF